MQLYEKVRSGNIEDYGKRMKDYIPLVIEQYSDRTHFIYEILQNAEDAGASFITFHLYSDRLEIIHNGRPFNERDIIGVCGIANGTKNDGTRIGHFGIGFKAVYGYTDNPMIYSGKYHFRIEGYLNPYEIPARDDIGALETCLILPFNKTSVLQTTAFKEIQEALVRKISAESILMLDKIQDIEIRIQGRMDVIKINKQKGAIDDSGNVFALNLLTVHENENTKERGEREEEYLFFTDAEEKATAIIFKVKGKELQEVRNSKIYAFFPTAKEAHQNFFIHAPFDTTPARDNFKQGEEYGKYNIELIANISQLIYFALCWLRDNGYLTISGFNRIFPIYEYEKTDILYGIYQNSIDIIQGGEKLLPTNKEGVFKSIQEVCVPESMNIVSVFNDEDLQRLMMDHNIFWLSKEISTQAYRGLREFLEKNFKFKTLDWRDLVLRMNERYLEEKSLSWMAQLMANIENACIKRSGQSHYIDVSHIPFVRLTNGKHICAKENGKLQVYLNNPSSCEYRIDEAFRKNEAIASFYERALGIVIYDIQREIIDRILPKYTMRQVQFTKDDHVRENIEDLKEIKEAVLQNPNILDQVRTKYIVTDGKSWFKPEELYIRSGDIRSGYQLAKGILHINYLSEKYFDDTVLSIKLDQDFFKKLGCSTGLKVREASKSVYLQTVKRYCGSADEREIASKIMSKHYISSKFGWDFCYEGFPDVFIEMDQKKSLAIAKFLACNTTKFEIKGELVGADDQNFSGSHVESVGAYSMIGLMLCFEKWIYVKGVDEPQRPIDIDKEDILEQYKPAERLMKMLPFKRGKDEMFNYLMSLYKDRGDAELIKRFMDEPDELLALVRAKVKSEAKQAAKENKKGSLKERLEQADREQKEYIKRDEDEGEVSAISKKALEKREKNLERILEESLDQKIRVVRGLSFTARSCSKEERTFLEQEYQGKCQICGKQLIKYNGEPYFEAINIIKRSSLQDKFLGGIELGWNSLCLCPNCAAAYQYSSKKISTLADQVFEANIEAGSDRAIHIEVEIPMGNPVTIKYSPRHLLALKKALQLFTQE